MSINAKETDWIGVIKENINACEVRINTISADIAILEAKTKFLNETPTSINNFKILDKKIFHRFEEKIKTIIYKMFDGFDNNCMELKHFMHFPKYEGFDTANPVYYGDTFQRALLLETLTDLEISL